MGPTTRCSGRHRISRTLPQPAAPKVAAIDKPGRNRRIHGRHPVTLRRQDGGREVRCRYETVAGNGASIRAYTAADIPGSFSLVRAWPHHTWAA